MLIYGASGHGKVVASCLIDSNIEVEGFFDDGIVRQDFLSFSFLGKYDSNCNKGCDLVLAIGDNRIRKIVAQKVEHPFKKVIHKTAIIDRSVEIGEGTVVFHGAIIQIDTKIGNHSIINTGASIDHDGRIGDFVHIAPQVTLCGSVTVGDNTLIGANSIVIPNLSIGKNCIIGAGSVVVNDLPDNVVALGNPAKILRINER